MKRRAFEPLAVTGIGLVTPAGIGTEPTWRGVLRGVPTTAPDPELAGLPVELSCRVPEFDPRKHVGDRQPWRLDRYTQFALVAAREAVADAKLSASDWDAARVAVVLGSAAGGVGAYERAAESLLRRSPAAVSALTLPAFLPNMAAGQLAIDLGVRGPTMHTATACASGASALITAALLLQTDACDIAIAGGADAMITPVCVAGFAQMGALSRNCDPATASRPFDAARDGFVISEGAGILVLERESDALARHAPVHALLAGYGTATDAHHPVAPHPEARGLTDAMRQALESAHAHPNDVDHVNAHGTSTPLNDRAEALALADFFAAHTDAHPAAPPTPSFTSSTSATSISSPTSAASITSPTSPVPTTSPTSFTPATSNASVASVTSIKGVLGHTMGAAGAIEAAITALTVEHQLVPATAGFIEPDSDTARIDLVSSRPRHQSIRLALSNSAGFGGHNVTLAFTPPRNEAHH